MVSGIFCKAASSLPSECYLCARRETDDVCRDLETQDSKQVLISRSVSEVGVRVGVRWVMQLAPTAHRVLLRR